MKITTEMFMKITTVFVATLAFLTATTSAQQLSGIEVTGKATVEAVPDVFVANFSMSDKGRSASKIKANIDNRSKQLIRAAIKMGVKEEDIVSANISLWSSYDKPTNQVEPQAVYSADGSGAIVKSNVNNSHETRKLTYHASRNIAITLTNIDGYEELLDAATKIGVSNVSPLSMQFSNAEGLYQQALQGAIKNATKKAKMMANSTNQELGDVTYLREVSYGAPSPMMMASESRTKFSPRVGKKTIEAQVIVNFDLQ